ncbi:MAG: hypothetical protein ACI9O6_001428 [Glaciecola sp.]|jgi:hypothetical protein
MENVIELKASASKYLDSVLNGTANKSFEEHIDETLRSFSNNPRLTNNPKDKSKALASYFGLVDFPALLTDKANNILVSKWNASTETWRKWVRMIPLNDFRATQISSVGLVPEPDEIQSGANFKYQNNLTGESVLAQLKSYGNLINLDRETFLNDRNGGFTSFLEDVATSYDRKIARQVYEFLINNPVSFEGKEIFHAEHGNIITKTASFEADLAGALTAIYSQTYSADTARDFEENVSIVPRFVIVPPTLAIEASKAVNALNEGLTTDQTLEVVIERRLMGFDGWFLTTNPDTITIAAFNLQGTSPTLEQRQFHNANGLEAKHRFDFDVKPVDYRGLVKVS